MSDDYRPLADPTVAYEIARVVLAAYDVEGYEQRLCPFERHLVATAMYGDPGYRDLLTRGFPGLVAAVRLLEAEGSAPLKALVDAERQKAWAS